MDFHSRLIEIKFLYDPSFEFVGASARSQYTVTLQTGINKLELMQDIWIAVGSRYIVTENHIDIVVPLYHCV